MVRILSALVLIPIVVGAIWLLPPIGLLAVVQVVLWLAFFEYTRLVDALGLRIPVVAAGFATAATSVAVALPGADLEPVLVAGLLTMGALSVATAGVGAHVVPTVATALFPALYLGLPLGLLVGIHSTAGRHGLLLLLLTVVASDTAQFYTGSMLGRRRLAPAISPKKSVEGAIGGFVGGGLAMVIVGHWWLPGVAPAWRLGLGLVVVATGILGDLFESQIKRSAGVKDSSALIPGHGGVLDRIDALLFAAPAYYLFLVYGL